MEIWSKELLGNFMDNLSGKMNIEIERGKVM
jgi:hypothetical protein